MNANSSSSSSSGRTLMDRATFFSSLSAFHTERGQTLAPDPLLGVCNLFISVRSKTDCSSGSSNNSAADSTMGLHEEQQLQYKQGTPVTTEMAGGSAASAAPRASASSATTAAAGAAAAEKCMLSVCLGTHRSLRHVSGRDAARGVPSGE